MLELQRCLPGLGFTVHGFGLRVQSLGFTLFRIQTLDFGVEGSRSRVKRLEFGNERVSVQGLAVLGLGV